MQHIIDRFISYVTIDTESDPNSQTTPSTEKQWNLANKLVEELKTIGLKDVTIDDKAYIMATLPSNVDHEVPTIGFVSHFDTSPDFSGANVKPQIIENYDGKDIILNAEKNIILSPNYFKDLLQYKGQPSLLQTEQLYLAQMIKQELQRLFRQWNILFSILKLNTGKSELDLRQMKKLDVAPIILMWRNLALNGPIQWMEVRLAN
jgi:hypothetical protein